VVPAEGPPPVPQTGGRLGQNLGAADSVLWKEMALWRMLIRGSVSGNMGKTS